MKQLNQKLLDGSMDVLDVAVPNVGRGMVLVKNHYSLISAGTEGGTVSTARKGLVGKARERPQQVMQVLDTLKQQGPVSTYRAVMKKLDSYSPLGYSSAGLVEQVGPGVKGIVVGDRVACAGAGYANHAEVVAVPANLCVKLPKTADLSRAAYNTLGAIAMQGVRQADLRVGESCAVIGLGLLGQLSALILRASGVRVIGLDISERAVQMAKAHCVDVGFSMSESGIEESVYELTGGIGADAVIIAAATDSAQPINFAGGLLRKRGTVVIVGDVPTGFEREPFYYKKELSLKMSCSYGPGRYDLGYEEKGLDYPAAYVRWTENRNMQAFQSLVHSGAVCLDYLTTHRFSIDDSPVAYDLILNKTEEFYGIIIEYDATKEVKREKIMLRREPAASAMQGAPGIGFIGAGSYAMSHLLPNIPVKEGTRLTGVVTSSGTTSRSVAEKFGFLFCASSVSDLIMDKATDAVFVATRHDTHAEYVQKALTAGKHVFVEKPLCLTADELGQIVESRKETDRSVMVGFNRRFSPLAQALKDKMGDGRMAMLYRVNAGSIPAGTWIQDEEIGGGRIIGEVCHFIDFLTFVCGSIPVAVQAYAICDAANQNDTLSISLAFENGSIGTICYFANGAKSLAKEYIEVYSAGITAVLGDFRELAVYGGRKTFKKKLVNQDKGQKLMVEKFVEHLNGVGDCPISFKETYASTLASLKIVEALRDGAPKEIEVPFT